MATLEDNVAIAEAVDFYNVGPIFIGSRTLVSRGARLCSGSHDFRRSSFDLLKPPIRIGSEVWICAGAFIGPGVVIGNRAVIGAHAVVTKSVPEAAIYAGNPADFVGHRDQAKPETKKDV